jgi:hypothetical protein
MSERSFRLISGMTLWAILLFSTIYENNQLMIAFCLLLLFEGLTNWRIPLIISRLRYGKQYADALTASDKLKTRFLGKLEAERMFRFIIVLFLLVSFFTFADILWFFPWYVAGMMIVAGISNICPMVMFLRWVGFR